MPVGMPTCGDLSGCATFFREGRPSTLWQRYLRSAGVAYDERMAEANELVASKRDSAGLWLLEARYPGVMPLEMDESEGQPSRWNTLRALRVLHWFERDHGRFTKPS